MEDEDKKVVDPNPDEDKKDTEGVSIVDEARAIRDEIKKEKEELKVQNDRKEKLQSEELLGSSAGGHVEAPQVSEEEKKQKGAEEFFKGTALADDIKKANG